MPTPPITHHLVRQILLHPRDYEWSVQGFGMLRLYLSDEIRLHIWDSALRVPGVSDIHDHPWDFISEIVAGELTNTLYRESKLSLGNYTYVHKCTIKCGEGAKTVSEPKEVYLIEDDQETFKEGDSYIQTADEIHRTSALGGTVTIVQRTFKKVRDLAQVWCDPETGFVSAEPREATFEEVSGVCRRSIERWFSGI